MLGVRVGVGGGAGVRHGGDLGIGGGGWGLCRFGVGVRFVSGGGEG